MIHLGLKILKNDYKVELISEAKIMFSIAERARLTAINIPIE